MLRIIDFIGKLILSVIIYSTLFSVLPLWFLFGWGMDGIRDAFYTCWEVIKGEYVKEIVWD